MAFLFLTWCLGVASPALVTNEPHAVEFCKNPVAGAKLAEGALLSWFIREGMPMTQVEEMLGPTGIYISGLSETCLYDSLGLTIWGAPLVPDPCKSPKVQKVRWRWRMSE
jgi:hypothetical protein